MREYELMYVLTPDLTDETLPPALEQVSGFITRLGGSITDASHASPWGKRRMQYPIEGHNEGIYVLANIQLDPSRTSDLERDLTIADNVLRHLLISKEK